MKTAQVLSGAFATVVALMGALTWLPAFAAPGEDPIQLNGPVQYRLMPTAPQNRSGDMDSATDIPAWMRARMTRYVAKAYSATADDGSIYTDNDVVTTVQTEGLRKTCVQEVGSNTVPAGGTLGTRYGPQTQDQVVVLRGDLVNVCR
ncbi:hypothetical protein [Hydrogenophaga sp. PAMC20947]|uniref:hypothetical protein n=1 Tax=Hydrogenophaga sp. PAMC20947 TaxID=2565558 RepID=UPI00109DC691|nr:hypothetical protein [Hydrogenophaga sp. PAMC20947]QCB46467.1 hypothetical protein E5678_10790 [Hydrogenophaga sp. PAMC20947]